MRSSCASGVEQRKCHSCELNVALMDYYAGRALASMDSGSYDDAEGFVAGRSLDEWSEALFPGATMRTTARFDPDSPYSRLIEARIRCPLASCSSMLCR